MNYESLEANITRLQKKLDDALEEKRLRDLEEKKQTEPTEEEVKFAALNLATLLLKKAGLDNSSLSNLVGFGFGLGSDENVDKNEADNLYGYSPSVTDYRNCDCGYCTGYDWEY
jgi:hypothetical protein